MKKFLENPKLLVDEFNKVAAIAQRKAFITVGLEIQKEEIEALQAYRENLLNLKKKYVESGLENEANLVYCLEKSLESVQFELQMLVNIKEDKMSEAWDNLIDAQLTYGTVLRNPLQGFKTANDNYIAKLDTYEKLLFPEMAFFSVGGVVKKCLCSICNDNYAKCNHIKGKLYNGELCTREISEMTVEEISFVETPANKHCRQLTISYNEKTVDVLTLREQSETLEDDEMSCIVYEFPQNQN